MRLWLERFGFGRDSTLGVLSVVEDEKPTLLCYTIEDERRKLKVPGETCIPTGVYALKLRTEGGLHEKYKARFPGLHRGMLWLTNVQDFQWVMIHCGNTDDDTAGCPLVVAKPTITPVGEFMGGDSTGAYKLVYPLAAKALEAGEDVVLMVTEREAA